MSEVTKDGEVIAARHGRPRMFEIDYEEKLGAKRQTRDGAEIPDEVPLAPPVGYRREPSMVDHIRSVIMGEQIRRAAHAAGYETFEEADDFDIDEDYEPGSEFEMEQDFEPVSSLKAKEELARKEAELAKQRAALEARERAEGGQGPAQPARATLDGQEPV